MQEILKSFSVGSVIILTLGLLFLVVRYPQGQHKTFSQHAAEHKHTIIYYNLLFTVVLTLLVAFFVGWFSPIFHLTHWFILLIATSSIAQYAATLIPEVGILKSKYHRILAGLSAFLLPPSLAILQGSSKINLIGKEVTVVSLIVMISIIFYVIVVARKRQKYLLIFQSGYFAAFFVAIVFAAYFGHR